MKLSNRNVNRTRLRSRLGTHLGTHLGNTATLVVLAASVVGTPAQALDFYGEINMSRQEISEGNENFSSIRSNGSAIGVTEERALNHGISAEFLLEYEIMPDQPVASTGGNYEQEPLTLSAGYVGLIGAAGKLKIGYFSTPLNILGEGVDHFTDLKGDKARFISSGDVDISDAVMYTSPEWQHLTARISHVSYEDENSNQSDGTSISLAYETDALFAGVAYDTEVEGDDIDLFRAVVRYPVGPVQVGMLWERRDALIEDDATYGWLLSADIEVSPELSIQAQHGRSDNQLENGRSSSIGATYSLGEDVSLYLFATRNRSDTDKESEVGTGISYVF